LNWLKNLSHLV